MRSAHIAVFVAAGGGLLLLLSSQVQAEGNGMFSLSGDPKFDGKVSDLADAITVAEGSPKNINNPGDLVKSFGYKTTGTYNAEGVLKFANAQDGRNALMIECQFICAGKAKATPNGLQTSWTQLAQIYAGPAGAANWAQNVADELGVDVNSNIGDWMQS